MKIDSSASTARSSLCGVYKPSGFTLLELLLATALFIVVLGILWNVVGTFQRTQTRGTRLTERSQLVRSLSQLMEDDLRSAIQDPIHPYKGAGGDDDIRRFGLSGSSQSLRIDVIEINPFAVQENRPARQAMFGEVHDSEPRAAELKTVFYDFNPETGLSRREIDFETPDVNAKGPEGSDMFAPEVVKCRFRYYNGTAWSDSWDSLDRDGLPVAIETTLYFMPLAEAHRIRNGTAANEDPGQVAARLGLSQPATSRIVAYLPTSPVRKFEAYERKKPVKKDEFPELPPLPPPPVVEQPPPPPKDPVPTGPQQSWIRGK